MRYIHNKKHNQSFFGQISVDQEKRLLREARLRAAAEKDRNECGGLDAVRAKDLRSVELHRCPGNFWDLRMVLWDIDEDET